jgi:hypothetical protein
MDEKEMVKIEIRLKHNEGAIILKTSDVESLIKALRSERALRFAETKALERAADWIECDDLCPIGREYCAFPEEQRINMICNECILRHFRETKKEPSND